MKHRKSSIPQNALEQPVREDKQEGTQKGDRVVSCFVNGILVGQRVFNQNGTKVLETPIKDGFKHGREFTWDDYGKLLLVEPYVKGKIHGTARQYGSNGKVMGTYTLLHGTGFDVWRQENEDGTVFVSEIHSLQDGLPHGFEWSFASARQDLWHERHWHMGKVHGIERIWNRKGKLRRGYPAFYVLDQKVSKQKYIKLALADKTLPSYQEQQNLPTRDFPPEIKNILSS